MYIRAQLQVVALGLSVLDVPAVQVQRVCRLLRLEQRVWRRTACGKIHAPLVVNMKLKTIVTSASVLSKHRRRCEVSYVLNLHHLQNPPGVGKQRSGAGGCAATGEAPPDHGDAAPSGTGDTHTHPCLSGSGGGCSGPPRAGTACNGVAGGGQHVLADSCAGAPSQEGRDAAPSSGGPASCSLQGGAAFPAHRCAVQVGVAVAAKVTGCCK